MRILLPLLICSLSKSVYSQTCDKYYERMVDKFDDKITFKTIRLEKTEPPVSFFKAIVPKIGDKPSFVRTYLYLVVHAPTVNVSTKGVYVLLKNGQKIIGPDIEIDVNADDSDFRYSALMPIDDDQIKQLIASEITDVRLYIYEKKVNFIYGDFIQDAAKCLSELK